MSLFVNIFTAMKTKILILLLFFATLSNAQTLKVSPESKIEKGESAIINVLRDEKENSIYVLRGQAWASYIDYTLEKYDAKTLDLIYFKTIYPTEKRKFFQSSWFVNIYLLDGKPFLLFKDHPPKTEEFHYYLIGINDKGEEETRTEIAGKAGKIGIITMKGDFPDEQLIITENKETPYIFVQTSGGKSKLTAQFTFLNKALQVIDVKQLKVPEVENYSDFNCVLNNETGELYVAVRLIEPNDPDPTMCFLYKMDKEGTASKVPITLPKSNWLSDVKLFYDEDKTPMIMGVSIFNGVFIEELKNTTALNNPEIMPFDKELQVKPDKGQAFCNIENVFIQNNRAAAVFRSYYKYYVPQRGEQPAHIAVAQSQYTVAEFNNNGIESSYNLIKPIEKGEDPPYDYLNVYTYPTADGYNIIVRSYIPVTLKNTNPLTYFMIKVKDGEGKETEVKNATKDYANNYSMRTYINPCYDSEGCMYMPWQLLGLNKREVRLFKFVP